MHCEETRGCPLYDQAMDTKRISRISGIAAMILALTVALTGCGQSSIFRSSNVGFPPGVDGEALDVPSAYSDEPILYLTLGGSSSCPPTPASIQVMDGVTEIEVKLGGGEVCTADFVVTTFEINLGPVPSDIVLIFENGDRQSLAVKPLNQK